MFQHMLVAIDGSESSLRAAGVAVDLATALHARLDILSVEETAPRFVATQEENNREHLAAVAHFEMLQTPIRQRAEQRGVETRCSVLSGHEGQAILEYIVEHGCDLLVLGHQGHSGVWGTFLGSTADKLVNHAPCSVLVIRPKTAKSLFKRLLVALDGSPLSWQAFQVSLQLAQTDGATLTAVSVIEGPVAPPAASTLAAHTGSGGTQWDWTTYFRQVQALAIAQAQIVGVAIETITREGHASSVLAATAQEGNYDLFILGATGQEHPWSSTTGGTARKVANETPCAVLLARPSILQRRVRDLMTTEVASVRPDTPMPEVITRLIEQGVKLLVVVNEGEQALGVITLGHLFTRHEAYRNLDLLQATDDTEKVIRYLRQFLATEKVAGDAMVAHPLVLTEETTIEDAARWMIAQRITRMPVVNTDQQLVGMLDQENLLHYYADFGGPSERNVDSEGERHAARPRTVGEAVISKASVVSSDTPLFEVMRQVQETRLRRIIVVDGNGKAVGVIADRDILAAQGMHMRRNPVMALAERFSLRIPEEVFRRRSSSGMQTAQQVMRPHLYAVIPATPVAEAVRLMLARQIKRLVVVDVSGKPLGFVDRQQLLRSLVEGSDLPH
jgi:nucleotide-binding universal stress UspA family protein/predicted transcriptional regulator